MDRLFQVLKKPNRLDDYAADDERRRGLVWYLTNTRSQILILHRLGQVYVITFCLAVCWASVTLGLPLLYTENAQTLYYAQLLMKYICFCIISNYILVVIHAKKSYIGNRDSRTLPISSVNGKSQMRRNLNAPEHSIADSDWTKCSHCDIEVPPRTRHCAICQTCVLKKDHHCFFTGCCIGFYNQRYFITFCFLGIIGGSWGLFNLGTFLSQNYAPFLSIHIYKYFLPVCFLSWLFEYATYFDFLLVLLFYLHITSTATSFYYFLWEMYIIFNGQTSYECVKRKRVYDSDFRSNMRSVFGPYWIVGFILPIPFPNNEGDGKTWRYHRKAL